MPSTSRPVSAWGRTPSACRASARRTTFPWTAEIKQEQEKITKNRNLLDEEKSRFQKETDQTRIRFSEEREELKQAKKALDAEKAELQKAAETAQAEILAEKQQLRESKGIMQTAEILRKMREDTRNAVKTMRERSRKQ